MKHFDLPSPLSFSSLAHSSEPTPVRNVQRVLLATNDLDLIHGFRPHERHSAVELVVADSRSALLKALRDQRFDLYVVDDDASFIATPAISSLAESICPNSRLVVIGDFSDVGCLLQVARSGVNSCISRRFVNDQLLPNDGLWDRLSVNLFSPEVIMVLFNALSDITRMHGKPVTPAFEGSTEANREAAKSGVNVLTERERELLRLGSAGLVVREIAETVHLSVHTVNTHYKNIYRKLEVTTRGDAIYRARALGEL